jgi:hypothetical protein
VLLVAVDIARVAKVQAREAVELALEVFELEEDDGCSGVADVYPAPFPGGMTAAARRLWAIAAQPPSRPPEPGDQ